VLIGEGSTVLRGITTTATGTGVGNNRGLLVVVDADDGELDLATLTAVAAVTDA
jgi:hypothetical protein